MITIFRMFFVACFVFLIGCHCYRQAPIEKVAQNKDSRLIKIENLTITDKTLMLDYRVSNLFEDDIRVFQDTNIVGFQRPVTRIDAETVWIQLRLCLNSDPNIHADPPAIAKYLRLPPGDSHSARILLDLPLRDNFREWRQSHKEHKEIILHRAVLEIGFFGPKFNKVFEGISDQHEKFKKLGIKGGIEVHGAFHYLPLGMALSEEIQDGKSREITYIGERLSFLCEEESAKAVITDVDIPCSVVVDGSMKN